jgi:hypothetical protein
MRNACPTACRRGSAARPSFRPPCARGSSSRARLRHVDRHRAVDVEAVAAEEAVRLHLERDDQVAGRRAGTALLALARQAQLRAGVDAGRHVQQDLALLADLAGAAARAAARSAPGRGRGRPDTAGSRRSRPGRTDGARCRRTRRTSASSRRARRPSRCRRLQSSVMGTESCTLPPRAATVKPISTTYSTSRPRAVRAPVRRAAAALAAPVEDRAEDVAESAQIAEVLEREPFPRCRAPAPAAPARARARPNPKPAKGFLRIASYCLRRLSSDRTEYASPTSLKRSAACGSLGFASGGTSWPACDRPS